MKILYKKIILLSLLTLAILPITNIHAQVGDYVPLAPLPGIETPESTRLQSYLPAIFNLSIGVAAALAFIMITFGGIVYATSDSITLKSDGKNYIENALWGLLLVLGAYAILYTINPKILSFNLSIDSISISTSTPTVTSGPGGGASTNGTGCQGRCPYSYINSNGSTVNYKDCNSCSPADSFGLDIKTKIINWQEAQINTNMGNSLKNVQNITGAGSFTVAETWPPTVNHRAQGQYDGTSVDVSLSIQNPANISQFISVASNQGLRVQYEVSNSTIRQNYINSGVPPTSIIVVPYITGEHFSVYSQ